MMEWWLLWTGVDCFRL